MKLTVGFKIFCKFIIIVFKIVFWGIKEYDNLFVYSIRLAALEDCFTTHKNHCLHTYHHRNGSILISRAAQGLGNSNLLTTLGCRTPRWPIDAPLTITSAHLPEKKVGFAAALRW